MKANRVPTSLSWSWFLDFCDYALDFPIYANPTLTRLSVPLGGVIYALLLSAGFTATVSMKLDMLL